MRWQKGARPLDINAPLLPFPPSLYSTDLCTRLTSPIRMGAHTRLNPTTRHLGQAFGHSSSSYGSYGIGGGDAFFFSSSLIFRPTSSLYKRSLEPDFQMTIPPVSSSKHSPVTCRASGLLKLSAQLNLHHPVATAPAPSCFP